MRILASAILAVSLVFGSCTGFAEYIPNDIEETKFEKDIMLLWKMNVIEDSGEGIFKPRERITRGEFAYMLKKLIAPEESGGSAVFSDVSEAYYAADAINYLAMCGYISGYGEGKFFPEAEISYDEAVAICLRILGYGPLAEYYGGFSNGYINAAAQSAITNGVARDGDGITRESAVHLLVNVMDTNLITLEFVGAEPSLVKDKEVTMLSGVCGIEKEKGTVEANEYYGISGNKTASEGTIIFNGKEIYADDVNSYVGYSGTCYYRENNGDYYMVCFIPDDNKNNAVTVEARDIAGYDEYSLSYENGDKVKKLKFDYNTVFVYNGKLFDGFSVEDLNIKNGTLEFLDNNGDEIYDLIKINEYFNSVIENVSDEMIYDKFSEENSVKIDDFKHIYVYDSDGKEVGIEGIKQGDTASVFKSKSNTDNIVKIILSDKTVEGTVSRTFSEDEILYVTIDGKDYELYSDYKTFLSDKIALGESGIFLLDYSGKITSKKFSGTGNETVGYLIDSKCYDDEMGERIIRMKVYSENGGMQYLVARNKVSVDGENYKPAAFEELNEQIKQACCNPILYKLNSKGEINKLDTVLFDKNNNEDKLQKSVNVTAASRYMSSTKIFEGRLAIDENTKVFIVPSEPKDARDNAFSFAGSSYFIGNQSYTNMTSYVTAADKITADVLVLQAETSIINNKSDVALITNVSESINDDEEAVVEFEVVTKNGEAVWQTADSDVLKNVYTITKYSRAGDTLVAAKNVIPEKGDLIKCAFDQNGRIEKVAVIYDASSAEMLSVNPYHGDFHESGDRYVMGTVDLKFDGVVKLLVNDANVEYHNLNVGELYIVDMNKKQIIQKGSLAEIHDNIHNFGGTNIIVVSNGGTPKMTFVYKSK